jgi:hypothetical protein
MSYSGKENKMQIILTILTGVLIIIAIDQLIIKPVVGPLLTKAVDFGPKAIEGIVDLLFGVLLLAVAHAIERIHRFPILLAPLFIAAVWAFFAFVLPMLPKGSSHEYISEYAPHAPRAELVRLP